MAVVAVDPADAQPGGLDRGDPALERLGAARAQRHVREAGAVGLGELERVAAGTRPSRAGRPTGRRATRSPCRARRGSRRRLSSGSGVSSSTWWMWARSLIPTRCAQAVEVVGERAGLQLLALDALAAPRARARPSSTSSTRSAATTAAPSASSTTRSPAAIRAPPTVDRHVDRAGDVLGRAADADPARPDRAGPSRRAPRRRARRRRRAAPRRRCACAWVASRSPTSATGAGSGIVSTSTSPGCSVAIAAWTIRLSSWPQRTVRAGPAAREPGTIRCRSRSTRPSRPAAS